MLSTLPVIIWMILSTILVIVVFNNKAFAFLDLPMKRNEELNGLRFFLAIGVVFHHFIYSYVDNTFGAWDIGGFTVNGFLGPFSVGIFFIISGYLFYNKISSNTDWKVFFINRFFRIVPLFTLSSLSCLIIAFYMSGLKVSFDSHLWEVLYWFDGGMFNYRPDITTYQKSFLINAGITWTLHWEWILYFSLPVLSLFMKEGNRLPVVIGLIALSYYIIPHYDYDTATYAALFAVGFLAKELKFSFKNKLILNLAPCLLLIGMISTGTIGIKLVMIPFYFLFFVICITKGSSFNLLRNKGVARLGEISYSIYLLHGIGWFIMNHNVNFSTIHQVGYLLISSAVLVIMMMISALTFKFIELPFMKYGKILENTSAKNSLAASIVNT